MKTVLWSALLFVTACGVSAQVTVEEAQRLLEERRTTRRAAVTQPEGELTQLRAENRQMKQTIDALRAQLSQAEATIKQRDQQIHEVKLKIAEIGRVIDALDALRAENIALRQQITTSPTTRSASTRPTISGSAWITRQAGQSDLLRGLRIHLLRRTVSKDAVNASFESNETHAIAELETYQKAMRGVPASDYLKEFSEKTKQRLETIKNLRAALNEQIELSTAYKLLSQTATYYPDFGPVVAAAAVTNVVANVDGKYQLKDCAAGDYYIYAR